MDLALSAPHLLHANTDINALRLHRNLHEVHRELKMTPEKAWTDAKIQKRTVLRPVPNCPWWPYVWSFQTNIRVRPDGRVPIGTDAVRLEVPPKSKVTLCLHPSGHHSVLALPPKLGTLPILLFSNRPK